MIGGEGKITVVDEVGEVGGDDGEGAVSDWGYLSNRHPPLHRLRPRKTTLIVGRH